MAFNKEYNEFTRQPPCINCKTRTPTCHGICNLYQRWSREQKKHSRQVKFMKKQHKGVGFNNPYAR